MCEDGGIEAESSGKYGTCGVIGYEKDANGKTVEVKKDSYYYMYTLKNTLGDFRFNREITAYDENVMIYEYVSADIDSLTVEFSEFVDKLEALGKANDLVIHTMHEDIFNTMHHI